MKINIKYPKAKCAYCGKEYTKTHNRQMYCSDECRTEGNREKTRNRVMKHYYRHKKRINQTRIGTRTIGPHKHENPTREQEIVQNEIDRIGLRTTFLNR
jgi:predicted nucleic acid-binding Zn ribbon protein